MTDKSIYKRLARAEAMAAAQRSEQVDFLRGAYQRACSEQREADAANLARALRNRLLEESDSRVALDRFAITVPDGASFSAWLSFLKALGEIISGEWAKYRQALRDLPAQPGFPYDIEFPVPPEGPLPPESDNAPEEVTE